MLMSLLAIVDISVVQSSAQTFIHNAILFIDISNNSMAYGSHQALLAVIVHSALQPSARTFLPSTNEVAERKRYVFTPVCHSVHRVVSAPVHPGIHTPLGRHHPGQTTPRQTPP